MTFRFLNMRRDAATRTQRPRRPQQQRHSAERGEVLLTFQVKMQNLSSASTIPLPVTLRNPLRTDHGPCWAMPSLLNWLAWCVLKDALF
jgi:hypothetical protein